MKKLSDEELFTMIRLDNERAFTAVFDRYKQPLFRHVYQRTGSETETEEILQNIFISLWKNRQTIVITDSIRPYLMGAAKRSVFAYYSRTAVEIEHSQLLLARAEPFEYPAEEFMIARELETLLDNEVEKMPSTMRQIFLLSRKEHLSVREIASILSVSEQTVKNNITLASKILRGKLSARHMIQLIPFLIFLS